MPAITEFLDRGILPFIGRSAEMDRIVAFWRSTVEAQGLRALLVIGEAGVGKSRLLERTIPIIAESGGAVIHVKLYPESAHALAPLVAQALWHDPHARRLLKGEPEGTLESVTGALRHLARLRPTLLAMEDIHLLHGESLRQFATILATTADEPLSVLALARPIELAARAPLSGFLTEELELRGLDIGEIESLWLNVFTSPADRDAIALLEKHTRGNPFAVRSALRGLLNSGALAQRPLSTVWEVAHEKMEEMLIWTADLLCEGMLVHLTPEERAAGEQLATLGEVFSAEAAAMMIDGAAELTTSLVFKGIIGNSAGIRSPISGTRRSAHPFAFTHTLLHRHLAGCAMVAPKRILDCVAKHLPLYSTLPFQLLTRHASHPGFEGDHLREGIECAVATASALNATADWDLGEEIWTAAKALLSANEARWDDGTARELRARLVAVRIADLRRSDYSDEYRTLSDELLRLTADPATEIWARHRLSALRYFYWRERLEDYRRCAPIWNEAVALIDRFPGTRLTREYVLLLRDVIHTAQAVGDPVMSRHVDREFTVLLALDGITDDLRDFATAAIAPHLLNLFSTDEELQSRIELLNRLQGMRLRNDMSIGLRRLALLHNTFHFREAADACDEFVLRARRFGLSVDAFYGSLLRLSAHAVHAGDLTAFADEAEGLLRDLPAPKLPALRRNLSIYLVIVGALRGDMNWTRAIVKRFLASELEMEPEAMVMMAAAEGRIGEIAAAIPDTPPNGAALGELARLAGDDSAGDAARFAEKATVLLRAEAVGIDELMRLHAVAAIVDMALLHGRAPDDLRIEIAEALKRALVRLDRQAVPEYMRGIVDRYDRYLGAKELAYWRGRIASLTSGRCETHGPEARMRVTMLGTITVAGPDVEPQKPGARLRTVLGLMVANRMVGKPLTIGEFRVLGTGGDVERDADLARKTINMAVARIRDLLGENAVTTRSGTPELNLDVVEVDLLEAHRMLGEARAALRERALLRALPLVSGALAITRGEVPFPGLYDEFFEAVREDFENTLRATIIDISHALLRQEDGGSAGDLLRRAFDTMPDDEEIAELLRRTLRHAGQHAEAERIRIRSEMQAAL